MFKGHGSYVPGEIQSFETWLGKPVITQSSGTGVHNDWGTIEGADWVLGPVSTWLKAKPGRQVNYQLSMMPAGMGITLAQIASGAHDARYRTAANRLAQYGMLGVEIRLGHEMDGNWYPWKAHPGSGLEADFVAAWRRIVTVMRQAQPTNRWVWVWNPTDFAWTDRAYLERLWPGDTYVDQIGIDCYDQTLSGVNGDYYSNGSTRLAAQQKVWSVREARLNILRDMAKAHGGKPLQFPEWALVSYKTTYIGMGGDDNPYFIQKMHEFFTTPANNVVMHAYFDWLDSSSVGRISPPDSPFPQSQAKFKELFGAGASQ